jgi:uncharacterized iron-regulated protein
MLFELVNRKTGSGFLLAVWNVVLLLASNVQPAQAALSVDGLFEGGTRKSISIEDVVSQVQPGGVLVLGEMHGNAVHHERQRKAIAALAAFQKCTLSVGLEFLSWPNQAFVDQFFEGQIGEADFLKEVGWGTDPFDNYRDQALFPRSTGGRLLALNAPRSLTGAISKKGLTALSAEELALMPPGFEVGSAEYRERFETIMGGHASASVMDRYFAAQSTWDDSMAWVSAEFLSKNPDHCLVIIVGDFHAQFGGGLPDRLHARGISNVVTVSQFDSAGLSEAEIEAEFGPHPKYGNRGTAVWISAESQSAP